MKELCELFQRVEDPRRSNATRHDLHEMLMIGLLSMLTGGRTCVDMGAFGRAWEPRLREFMKLGHGIPSHDAFSAPRFREGRPVQGAVSVGVGHGVAAHGTGLGGCAGRCGGGGRQALRRSFEDATQRSALYLVQAFAAQAKLTLAQLAVEGKSNEIPAAAEAAGTAGREGPGGGA